MNCKAFELFFAFENAAIALACFLFYMFLLFRFMLIFLEAIPIVAGLFREIQLFHFKVLKISLALNL